MRENILVSLRPDKRNIKINDMKVRNFLFHKILRKIYPTILTDYTIDVSLRNYKSNDKATNNGTKLQYLVSEFLLVVSACTWLGRNCTQPHVLPLITPA